MQASASATSVLVQRFDAWRTTTATAVRYHAEVATTAVRRHVKAAAAACSLTASQLHAATLGAAAQLAAACYRASQLAAAGDRSAGTAVMTRLTTTATSSPPPPEARPTAYFNSTPAAPVLHTLLPPTIWTLEAPLPPQLSATGFEARATPGLAPQPAAPACTFARRYSLALASGGRAGCGGVARLAPAPVAAPWPPAAMLAHLTILLRLCCVWPCYVALYHAYAHAMYGIPIPAFYVSFLNLVADANYPIQ
jgi:hypothetical protein